MAHITLDAESGILQRIFAAVDAVGRSLAVALTVNVSAEARLREVERLRGLSDAELSAMGIDRDRIVHHVFRDLYMV